MGKGKKKGGGDKKSETQEDTSQPPSEQPSTSTAEPEEEDGLLGKSRKQLRQQKKAAKLEATKSLLQSHSDTPSVPSETASRAESEAPETAPEPVQQKTEETIIEELDGLGLGLGGGARKRPKPRKKKADAGQQASAAGEPVPVSQGANITPIVSAPSVQIGVTSVDPVPSPTRAAPASATAWGSRERGQGAQQDVTREAPSTTRGPPGFSTHSHPPAEPIARSSAPTVPQGTPIYPVAQKQPVSSLSQLSVNRPHDAVLCRYRIPHKIPKETIPCRKLNVLTNYLAMDFKPLKIARYDVAFKPDRPKKMLAQVFAQIRNKYFSKELLAFDQMKNCYSLRPLPNVSETVPFVTTMDLADMNGKIMHFEVTVKFTGIVDLGKIKNHMDTGGSSLVNPTEEIQCVDVILRQGTLESYVKAGRQFFKRPNNPVDLGYGYEMWTGLFQSAIFTDKAFINIDVAHKGFPRSQSLIDAMTKDFSLDPTKPLNSQRFMDVDYFKNFIKGLRVLVTLVSTNTKREFICNDIVAPPSELNFTMDDNTAGKSRVVNVADYYLKEKKYRIKYPRLNCLWVGPTNKKLYFPMELVEIAHGQAVNRQLNDVQVAVMVKEAATPPSERLRKIEEVKSSMLYSTNKDFKSFGLDISDKFHRVQAKILNPPLLDVGPGQTLRPSRGQWNTNSLLKAKTLESWGYIALEADGRNDNQKVINLLINTAKQMGMDGRMPKMMKFDARMQDLHRILIDALDKGIRFMMIVVSSRGRDHYHRIKQMAECNVGILTQCLKESTVRKFNGMTAKNLLLKMNSKMMGINQALETKTMPKCLRDGGVMIVGADVTHPSPDQANVPSIAAVTASMDPKCYLYNIELSIQTPKKEVIIQFEDMMFDHLRLYKERNQGELPRKIFVFRDGVSEGQFAEVMNNELQAIHNAYNRMSGGKRKPEVLFLLVQKRHHTRLFIEGSVYNVEPGTVVDKDIVHASELDFYLVSHQALKGTARPTRYHAICNDGNIPDDEVEQLTFYLCHLYARCMRSVSYPTPTYYAHLACFRARSLTYGEKFDNRELEQRPKRLHVLDKMLQFSRMFFV